MSLEISGKTRQAMSTSQETCLYESPVPYEDRIGENRAFLCVRIFTKLFLRSDTGDFYLEKIGGETE